MHTDDSVELGMSSRTKHQGQQAGPSRCSDVVAQLSTPTAVLVLFSGGLDSTACVHFYLTQGFKVRTLFVSYGQLSAEPEASAAAALSRHYRVPLRVLKCDGATGKTGGVIMGLNYALFEERIMDRATGRQVNPDMEFYKLGGIRDMPKITVHLQDMPERGVIGIGEPPTISTAAAIGNAVCNAIGVRVPITPFTPDKVLAALAKKGGGA